jgi:hypothetical protein
MTAPAIANIAPNVAHVPPPADEGDAAQDAFVVSVLVQVFPEHVVLPDEVTDTWICEVTTLFSAAAQSLTLLLLLSTKFPSQKIAPL